MQVLCFTRRPLGVKGETELDRIEGARVGLTAAMLAQVKHAPQVIQCCLGNVVIERRIRQAHDLIAQPLELQCFAGISLADPSPAMPVGAVNLKHRADLGQVEVYRGPHSSGCVFLSERYAEGGQCESYGSLRNGLTHEAAVTAEGAVPSPLSGSDSKVFAARFAFLNDWRAAAFFRAIAPAFLACKDATTTRTGHMLHVRISALKRAVVVPIRLARCHAEQPAAARASFGHEGRLANALLRAVAGMFRTRRRPKDLAALLARRFLMTHGLATRAVRVLSLMGEVAGTRAVMALGLPYPGSGSGKGCSAVTASAFHVLSISRTASHSNHPEAR